MENDSKEISKIYDSMNTKEVPSQDAQIESLINNYVAENPNSVSETNVKVDIAIEQKAEFQALENVSENNSEVVKVEVSNENQTPVKKEDELPEYIKILTIDDDKWIQRIFSQYLHQWGFKHFAANDPFTGLSEAMRQQPHLIFLDLIMPEVSGEVLLQFLKNLEFTRHIPVVIISGNLNKEVLRNTYIHGAKGFISKPFNQDILYSKIKEVIDSKLFEKMVDAGRIVPITLKKKPHLSI